LPINVVNGVRYFLPHPDDTVTVYVKVKNWFVTAAPGAFNVRLSIRDGVNDIITPVPSSTVFLIQGLGGGHTADSPQYELPFTPHWNTFRVSASVDVDNTVREGSEANNQCSLEFYIDTDRCDLYPLCT
jgi:hypothetical protein